MTPIPVLYDHQSIDSLNQFQESPEAKYVLETVQKISEQELKEDVDTREHYLKQFKKLLHSNVDIQNLRIDDSFLLRFLRVKKYNITMSEQIFLKYLNLRRIFPQMCTQLDCLNVQQNAIITNGYIFASPKRDTAGRRIVIVNAKLFNAKQYSSADQAKAHILTYETLLEDPINQVMGLTHIGDLSGITASHVFNWNPTDFARILRWGEQSIPIRHKAVHLVNVPLPFKWIIDVVKSRISQKMRKRFHAHTNMKELKKHVDIECLPKEMGGSIPMKDMIESWKAELITRRESIISLDKMKLLNDHGIISKRNIKKNTNDINKNENIDSKHIEDFKKLDLD